MKLIQLFLSSLLILSSVRCGKEDGTTPVDPNAVVTFAPVAVNKSNSMKLFVHYMPWFETKESSGNGSWGYHWTMKNKNPDIVDANGKREIASHFYPKIGPYASSDEAVLEYHMLLMKYAGVDGILIDWYGTYDMYDYGSNKRNTEAIVRAATKVGLSFAIVYEDAIVPNVMAQFKIGVGTLVAKTDMKYLNDNFFSKENYIKIDNKPLFLVFGPQYFKTAAEWTTIFSSLTTKPCFLPLWSLGYLAGANASGEYIWVDQTNLDTKYNSIAKLSVGFGGAYPGFKDFYKEGGAGNNLFVIDHNNGAVWDNTLAKAKEHNVNVLQLITWNDFGEGTMIEPTEEFQYLFLEKLQVFAGVQYQKADLEAIFKQYELRKSLAKDADAQRKLDQAFQFWISLQNNKAKEILTTLASK